MTGNCHILEVIKFSRAWSPSERNSDGLIYCLLLHFKYCFRLFLNRQRCVNSMICFLGLTTRLVISIITSFKEKFHRKKPKIGDLSNLCKHSV